MNEFELIRRYFTRPAGGAVLGVGDDAAILRPTPDRDLHVSVDMLVEGRHFFADVAPEALGHKTLAVNLSDMAAMGAAPRWVVLSLALPVMDETWAAGFSRGFFALAERYGVDVIGGDTTRGPLTLSVTVGGETPRGQALRRAAARVGDDVWVSGELGLGAMAVRSRLGRIAPLPDGLREAAWRKLEYPEPRIALGLALLPLAHAAADVSDGLLSDLGHIAVASQAAVEVWADALPSHPLAEAAREQWLDCLAAGGDDYELVFTAPAARRAQIEACAETAGCRLSRIGRIAAGQGVSLLSGDGNIIQLESTGYDHFK
ncbi:thiamine-phosphate kinase [Chromobacterium haemolyticum]|uniref:Thiamine-monophosphate kinase n=1 Tax=Chromobacterium fluminis TaxID=3044269 RepID=A0ABX0KZS1_9NEIS|nr:thiamine-phosphate kinase [Chromobacterium haemolyticum]NHR05014.1 thiamine-phosphate kinase [Chromobacterium haemolyticum]